MAVRITSGGSSTFKALLKNPGSEGFSRDGHWMQSAVKEWGGEFSFSDDGEWLVATTRSRGTRGQAREIDGSARLWDLRSASAVRDFQLPMKVVHAAGFLGTP